jgi:antitoxin ParD1/3/4
MESAKNMTFSLGAHDQQFIASQVEHGRFGNRTEVVRAALRLLEDYENSQKLQRLRAAIARGDADIAAGRMKQYDTAEELLHDILNADDGA